jgi:hypothetical protein
MSATTEQPSLDTLIQWAQRRAQNMEELARDTLPNFRSSLGERDAAYMLQIANHLQRYATSLAAPPPMLANGPHLNFRTAIEAALHGHFGPDMRYVMIAYPPSGADFTLAANITTEAIEALMHGVLESLNAPPH